MTDRIELTTFQQAVKDSVKHATGRGKHCARSAMRHLDKAWAIRAVDKEMAAFRVVTAEEEAATAIFFTLKKYRYPHAEMLKPRDHSHKAALYPFLTAVAETLSVVEYAAPEVFLSGATEPPKLSVRFDMKKFVRAPHDGQPKYAEPVPPLHWAIRLESGEVMDFGAQMTKLAENGGFDKIIDYVRHEANFRNRLLYAADDGIPTVDFSDQFILARRNRVFHLLTLYLLIDQYPEHQLFVTQCLQGFLKLHARFEPDLSAFKNLPDVPTADNVIWVRPPSDP